MSKNIMTFAEAIEDSDSCSSRHLILGNGFSISCCPNIFTYKSLYEQADFANNEELKEVFKALETKDFETTIRNLETGASLVPIYAKESNAAQKMKEDAESLKTILISTIARNHPQNQSVIDPQQVYSCKIFLENFIGQKLGKKAGKVFSLNYDLLLYWVVLANGNVSEELENTPPSMDLKISDGFGDSEDDPDADYVIWQGDTGARNTSIYFLHGALHLFDAGDELQKYTWRRTGLSLTDQAQNAINLNKFPLFVTEGSSKQKKRKIRHNAYLYQGLKVLRSNAIQAKNCFFIHGHSLAKNDNHILDQLGKGKFKELYVSLLREAKKEDKRKIIERAEEIANQRHVSYPLTVKFYDADSANVWNKK